MFPGRLKPELQLHADGRFTSLTDSGMLVTDLPSSRTSTEYKPASANCNCWKLTMKLRVRKCMSSGSRDFHRQGREVGHDGLAVGVDEIKRELVLALVGGEKRDSERHGALQMHRRHLRRIYRVERAQQAQFFVVACRRVAKNRRLNVHAEMKPRISGIGTHFFQQHFPA